MSRNHHPPLKGLAVMGFEHLGVIIHVGGCHEVPGAIHAPPGRLSREAETSSGGTWEGEAIALMSIEQSFRSWRSWDQKHSI